MQISNILKSNITQLALTVVVGIGSSCTGTGEEPSPQSDPEPTPAVDAGGGADTDAGPTTEPEPAPPFEHIDQGDGVTLTKINAASLDFIYLDLETKTQVFPATPEDDPSWDLTFSRFHVGINGGATGTGGMAVAPILDGTPFDAITTAPATGYMVDEPDADSDGINEFVISVLQPWYDYDDVTHVVSRSGRAFVVRTVEGNYYKLEIIAYYNDDGDSGYPQMLWAPVAPPPPLDGGVSDAGGVDGGASAGDAGLTDAGAQADAGATDAGAQADAG